MLGAMYLALLPLLAYLSGNRDSIKTLLLFCLAILVDLIITDFFKLTLDNFFLGRAIVDLILLVLVYYQKLIPIKKWLVSVFVFTSLCLNIYLCFELDNVFLYRQWETINLVLCELIFLTLIISDRTFNMFSTIKTYIYGAIAAVGLFLVGWLKYLSNKNDKLQKEVQIEKNNVVVLEKQKEQSKELNQALSEVKKEADEVAHENNQRVSTRTRPSGKSFGDKRVLNNKD